MIPEHELETEKEELKRLVLDDKKNVAKEESSDEDIATKNKSEGNLEDFLDLEGEKIKYHEKANIALRYKSS